MAIEIEITWQEPQHYSALKDMVLPFETGFLYKEVSYINNEYALLTIGHSFAKNNFPHPFEFLINNSLPVPNDYKMVSIGFITSTKTLSDAEILEVEAVLIMAHSKNNFPDISSNNFDPYFKVKNRYLIKNIGFRKDNMLQSTPYLP